MQMLRRLAAVPFFVGVLGLMGCGEKPATTEAAKDGKAATTTAEEHGHEHTEAGGHGHGAGPHEGTLTDWGGGKYHVEFTVDHDKKEATIYVLGSDEKTASPVKASEGKLILAITEPAFQVDLKAVPLDGESGGASSRYVGQHESLGIVREFAGTISAEVEGTPYAGDFKEEPHGDHDHK